MRDGRSSVLLKARTANDIAIEMVGSDIWAGIRA